MKLDIPYYSQKLDVARDEWKKRACGVTALKMALEYVCKKNGSPLPPSIDQLIDEGVFIGGYTEAGWIHDALVSLAHNYGAPAYREEFRSKLVSAAKKLIGVNAHEEELVHEGVQRITTALSQGRPVIASVLGRFKDGGEYHLVVLTGFEGDVHAPKGFYYHEPSEDVREQGVHQFVPMDTFLKYWRKMAIFVG